MATEIYILRLQQGKYYIGKSANAEHRIEAHKAGGGSFWTKKYKMIEVVEIIKNANIFDEDRYTKEYMAKYGIDNVRGGSYVTLILTDEQKELIKREIWGAEDRCARCGKNGHFIRQCSEKSESESEKNNTITFTIPMPIIIVRDWFNNKISEMQKDISFPKFQTIDFFKNKQPAQTNRTHN